MTTFSALDIPFPLFEAPVSEASDYSGKATCGVCRGRDRHCFGLNIGCALILPCPMCSVGNGLDTHDRQASPCRSCGSEIAFPKVPKREVISICFSCLRAGKGAITKDTEFGMVSWEQAFEGVTHGVPGLKAAGYELVLVDPEDDWYGVRVPSEYLFELLQTPTYSTWQGGRWLFCCKQPMTYIGEWANVMKSPHRPDDKRKFFDAALEPDEESKEWLWKSISNKRRTSAASVYFFQCKKCGRYRANWDID